MVFTISVSPIQIPIKERDEIRRADWNMYRQILEGENVNVGDAINTRELDTVGEACMD